jgi:predicted nucleotidyltransferase
LILRHFNISPGAVADLCRRHHIRKLSLFGSVLREDFGPDSDVDVLVDFELEHIPGFLRLHEIEQELSALLDGRRVDLITEKFLNRRIRDGVLAAAEVCYAEG